MGALASCHRGFTRRDGAYAAAMVATARAHPVLAAFTLAYLVVFLVAGLAVGSDVAVPYVVLIVAVVVLICRIHERFDLGTGTLWGMAIWGLGHLAGGIVPIGDGRTSRAEAAVA